jgi:hypothetical protein
LLKKNLVRAVHKVLLEPLHLVGDAKVRAWTYRLKGIGLWLGRGLNIGHTQIPAQIMESPNGSG